MRTSRPTLRFARSLRKAMSPPEVLLWLRLRTMKSQGIRFRRQHPVGPYVLDFYCPDARLAVEVDGLGHAMGDRPKRDEARDAWLAEQRVEALRLPAEAALRNTDETAQLVYREVNRRSTAK